LTPQRRQRLLLSTAVALIIAVVAVSQSASSTTTVADPIAMSKFGAQLSLVPPAMAITPASGAQDVGTMNAVRVTATSGTLTDVRMTNEQGRLVEGRMTPDRRAWQPIEPLGYGRDYVLSATGRGPDSTVQTQTSRFSTVVPETQTAVSLRTTAGTALRQGGTYGVGTVVVAQFDAPVADRAAAQQRLKVTTQPAVEGAWSWVNDSKAHWRPREYYPAGTRVSVEANVYGADLGDGVYGDTDRRVDFQIGRSHVSIADDVTKQVSVFVDGQLVRTMPTSMGRGGTETVGSNTIAFWTQRGIYTVMDKANPVIMDSSTYGLPVSSSSGYRVTVPYATRISPDGIYLHQLEDTVWAHGNTNVSAGCLNLNAENAKWFYELSQPGDVVEIRNTGGAPLEQWQNGDWSVPWDDWLEGSALRA
jgi:lipoprotein-anchoring transpeptidase ErfK/SrfK